MKIKKKKNQALLQSDMKMNQIFAKVLILFPNAHNDSRYLSFHHKRIQERNSWENNLGFITKTCKFHLMQLSPESLTMLHSVRMPSQGGGCSFRNLSNL